MRFNLNLLGYEFALNVDCREKRTEYVAGYTNRCKDGKYCIFLDYDNSKLEWIRAELRHLQHAFLLSDFYVFQSSKDSYHAVCFDKVTLQKYIQILKNSSVDVNYIYVPLHYGKKIWSLRLTDKNNLPVKHIGLMKGGLTEREQSSPHAKLINTLFKLNIKLKNPDNLKDLIICRYRI